MTELTFKVTVEGDKVDITVIDVKTEEVKAEETVGLDCREKLEVTDRLFDNSCPGWTTDPEHNKLFLMHQQRYFTDKLKRNGHLYLNEVLDGLGLGKTKAGQLLGWIYDENKPDGNFVDFGIYRDCNADFIDGWDSDCWLRFNIDGNIWELMD